MTTRKSSAFVLFCLGMAAAASAAEPVADAACPEYDQFTQQYEYTDRSVDMRGGALCAGSNLSGNPSYPERRVDVRIEYRRGEYFVAQETREWEVTPDPSGCLLIRPRLVREYRMRVGQVVEWALYAPDKTRRTRDGHPVGNSLIAGTAKARQPRPTKVEETPFGVNCGRIDATNAPGVYPGGSLCQVYLPKKCTSELYMAPIDFFAPVPAIGPQRGRTRELVIGSAARVDPTAWSIP